MADPLVEAVGVSRRFGSGAGAFDAVREASCTVRPSDRISLAGPSGSGKSTLLHLLAGIDRPSAGSITWPALGPREELRPGKIAIVFQGPSLLAPLTAVENVCLPLLMNGMAEREARVIADQALERLNVAELADKLPGEISGGQAQRIAIARALAVRPRLLLADEPTGQLDSATASEVITTILAVVGEIGAAALVATHDPQVASRFAATWEMRAGHLAANVPCST